MYKRLIPLICCLLCLAFFQGAFPQPSFADEKEERVKLLQEKLKKLKQLLVQMEEQKLKETPPTATPWEPLIDFGLERPAYDQYVYLVAPQMKQETLDSVLQQLYFFSNQDELKERGALFVIPARPLSEGESMSVDKYNRGLAAAILRKLELPTALEGLLLITPDPIDEEGVTAGPLLLIDLVDIDQILRARIVELLQQVRLFTEDGSLQDYLWELLKSASPQAFEVAVDGKRMWLAVDND